MVEMLSACTGWQNNVDRNRYFIEYIIQDGCQVISPPPAFALLSFIQKRTNRPGSWFGWLGTKSYSKAWHVGWQRCQCDNEINRQRCLTSNMAQGLVLFTLDWGAEFDFSYL